MAGVHLPEGNYSASLTAGTGYMNITDDENGIYIYQSFGYEEEYDEVTEMDDIRLFDGAVWTFQEMEFSAFIRIRRRPRT